MPLLTYRCPSGHAFDHLHRSGERPETLPCACGGVASRTIAVPSSPVVAGRKGPREGVRVSGGEREGFTVVEETERLVVREKGGGLTLVDWRCDGGHTWFDTYTAKPETPPPCATCGLPGREITGVPDVDWFTKLYGASGGYMDRGLGCWVRSLEHRREIMNARGLVEYGEVGDVHEAWQRKDSEQAQSEKDAMREMLRGMEHGPDAATLKTARDRGQVLDWEWAERAVGGLR